MIGHLIISMLTYQKGIVLAEKEGYLLAKWPDGVYWIPIIYVNCN
jgi:hypothetical protein